MDNDDMQAVRLHDSISFSQHEAEEQAHNFACRLMISHLYHSHGKKARELARMYGIKVKDVQDIISGKIEEED